MSVQQHNIRYAKAEDDVTNRTVVMCGVPPTSFKALDVSHLSPEEQIEITEKYEQFVEYQRNLLSSSFNFTDWCQHTANADMTESIKWRTFLIDKTTFVD